MKALALRVRHETRQRLARDWFSLPLPRIRRASVRHHELGQYEVEHFDKVGIKTLGDSGNRRSMKVDARTLPYYHSRTLVRDSRL
ncbi:MAG: hypothetical protein ACLQIB_00670 [Isosphaeraceae bacterium]